MGPSLRLAPAAGRPPKARGETREWLDVENAIWAGAWLEGERRGVILPACATFVLDGREQVRVFAAPGATRDAIEAGFETLRPYFLQSLGEEVLHASAVAKNGRAIALAGRSGAGKSTLAAYLSTVGALLRADDATRWRIAVSGARIAPLPFRPRLRAGTIDFLAHPLEGHPAPESGEALAAILALEDGPPAVARKAPAEAFAALLACAFRFAPDRPARKRRMVEKYLALAATVPVYRFASPRRFDHLPEAARAIAELAGWDTIAAP